MKWVLYVIAVDSRTIIKVQRIRIFLGKIRSVSRRAWEEGADAAGHKRTGPAWEEAGIGGGGRREQRGPVRPAQEEADAERREMDEDAVGGGLRTYR